MFKDIIETRKRTALLYDAIEEVITMIERAERMFGAVGQPLDQQELAVDIDQEDRDINAGEQLVRRMVMQHLVINPDQDLSTSLALISIVHDVERMGDYAKSLAELNQWHELCSGEGPCPQLYREIHGMITPLFPQVLEALREDNAATGSQVMQQHEQIKVRTDEFVAVVMDDDGAQREAVLYTLASRFLRRTSAHLSNVASSMTNPLDRITGKEA
ncbi:MAG: hypothetical protein GKR89_07475 [Candidatus Latescibacteria bacterium]|nr:hypothetical protein [Candidatus Latescibacterota bacterium]